MRDTGRYVSPYPGLRPFNSEEADIFFGREAHTDRLLEILQREHFLAVIGPSGSGKSSLVGAGLLPSLKMGNLGSGSNWRIAVLRPGTQPIRSLARALLRHDVFGSTAAASSATDEVTENAAILEAELRRGPLGLAHATLDAREAVETRITPDANLLVVVDQFEELFTYAETGDEHADESDSFVNLLLEARADATAQIYVVLTMRTDFLGNCVRFPALPEAINRAQYLTPRLTRTEMESAISGPAEVCGGSVEPSLVAELINATRQNSDQLPVLQHALSRMWSLAVARDGEAPSIRWDDAQRVGGLSGALDQHAESILASVLATIGPGRASLVEGLFAGITERRGASGGGQDVRRPQLLSRIAQSCNLGDDWQALAPIVRAYAAPGVSLLQHGHDLDGASVIDLSHEALMRQWKRLSEWVDAESRRRNNYRRWAERATEHVQDRGGLLEGAALARATEWLHGDTRHADTWRPTAAWAAQYTVGDDASEFTRTVAFIEQSAEQARKRQQDERASEERERRASIERAEAATRQARRQLLLVAGFAMIVVALAATAYYYARQSREYAAREAAAADSARAAAQAATAAEARAQFQQSRAEEYARRFEAQLTTSETTTVQTLSEPLTVTMSASQQPIRPPSTSPPPSRGAKPSSQSTASISIAELAAIMPASTARSRGEFLRPLNDAMAEFSINTPLRRAHFLGQLSFESGDLRYLRDRWIPTDTQLRYEPPNSLALSLGNTQPGDGQTYLGRGIFQITGRGNYRKFGDLLGLNLIEQPDLAARPDVAARAAGALWRLNGLNELADADDLTGITRRISGGINGLESRSRAVARAKAVLHRTPAQARSR